MTCDKFGWELIQAPVHLAVGQPSVFGSAASTRATAHYDSCLSIGCVLPTEAPSSVNLFLQMLLSPAGPGVAGIGLRAPLSHQLFVRRAFPIRPFVLLE
ncbi:hypothetical protein SKAU_G00309470 [Synaphobranchus kaupii]|uniref:Uncharacterized protein n=1 Tax=Synaphobranchus kaupii TaxID=118154 RepID=A0A9Q1IKW6_SYNKA|nr:hypothetical protein SKAU_G00309470 [Synaphobranchus kaupii]